MRKWEKWGIVKLLECEIENFIIVERRIMRKWWNFDFFKEFLKVFKKKILKFDEYFSF
jgi:hypothetical protein